MSQEIWRVGSSCKFFPEYYLFVGTSLLRYGVASVDLPPGPQQQRERRWIPAGIEV